MHPFSFLHLIRAANTGTRQNFFLNFDIENYADYTYTATAHAQKPNTGVFNVLNHTGYGQTNCTNSAVVFGSIPPDAAQVNLWSCAFYVNLTRDFRDETLRPEDTNVVVENAVDTNISTSNQVTTFLSTCLVAWCDNSEQCGKSACRSLQLDVNQSTILSAAGIDTCLNSICGVKSISSPDIAGIGVIVSIFIQLSITLAAPVILLLCQIARKWITQKCNDVENGLATRVPLIPLISIRTLEESVLATLDDFQRAQCCFAIAIDIASLITLFNGPEKPTRIDRNAISLASFAGTLPPIVILATLLIYKERGLSYTVYLTTATWILSLVTGYLPLTRSIGEMPYTYIANQPAACGYQPPEHVCKEWGVESSIEQFSWIASILSVVAMSFLAARWILPAIYSIYVRSPLRTFITTHMPKPVQHHYGHWVPSPLSPRFVKQGLRSFIYLALFISVVNCGVYIMMILTYMGRGSMHTEWGFGQVVAVAVWLPTILGGLGDAMYGTLRGRSNMLPGTLRVIRVDAAG